jgi:hypothetical protein
VARKEIVNRQVLSVQTTVAAERLLMSPTDSIAIFSWAREAHDTQAIFLSAHDDQLFSAVACLAKADILGGFNCSQPCTYWSPNFPEKAPARYRGQGLSSVTATFKTHQDGATFRDHRDVTVR